MDKLRNKQTINTKAANVKIGRFDRFMNLMKYAIVYFHTYLLFTAILAVTVLYYFISITNRIYYEVDRYTLEFTKYRAHQEDYLDIEKGIGALDVSLVSLGAINYHIVSENYEKAIMLIDNMCQKINVNAKLYRILKIKQALLYMKIVKNIDAYETIVLSKYISLKEDTINSLISVYKLHNGI